MAVVTLPAARLDTAGVVATRTWTRVAVVLAAAGDTVRIPVPPSVGRLAYLRIESGVETVRPVVDGVQASLASVSADWRLSSHGQVFTPQNGVIDVVPTLQGAPTLPATIYVSAAVQEGAGAVAMGARIPNAGDIDLQQYAIWNAETPDGSDESQLTTVGYVVDAVAAAIEDVSELFSLPYAFDTVTSPTVPAAPAAGALRLNNADPALATAVYLSETDSEGIARGPEIAIWDDTFATQPAVITLRSVASPAKFAAYFVTGANVDSGTYDRLTVALKASNGGAFTAAEPVLMFFSPPSNVALGYQPLDSDLTAIAALTTTAYGRALLTLANAAAADWLAKAGGTMSGAIAMGAQKITGLAAPTAAGDAVRFDEYTIAADAFPRGVASERIPVVAGFASFNSGTAPALVGSRGAIIVGSGVAGDSGGQIDAPARPWTDKVLPMWSLGGSGRGVGVYDGTLAYVVTYAATGAAVEKTYQVYSVNGAGSYVALGAAVVCYGEPLWTTLEVASGAGAVNHVFKIGDGSGNNESTLHTVSINSTKRLRTTGANGKQWYSREALT